MHPLTQDPLTLPCALHPQDGVTLARADGIPQIHLTATQEGHMVSLFLDRDGLLRAHNWIGRALNATIPAPAAAASGTEDHARTLLRVAEADPATTLVVAILDAKGAPTMVTRCDRPRDLARIAASLSNEAVERIDMSGGPSGFARTGLLIACTDAARGLREALGDD